MLRGLASGSLGWGRLASDLGFFKMADSIPQWWPSWAGRGSQFCKNRTAGKPASCHPDFQQAGGPEHHGSSEPGGDL